METEQAAASSLTNEDKLFPNVRWCGVGNLAAICYGNLQAKDSKVSLYSISNCGVGRRNAALHWIQLCVIEATTADNQKGSHTSEQHNCTCLELKV